MYFNPTLKEPFKTTNRGGNTDLEFNMNSHIRKFTQIFIVQTEANGAATAKQCEFDPKGESGETGNSLDGFPQIVFTNPTRGYAKDCWMVKIENVGGDERFYVKTVCKSSTDEYLNADCMYPAGDNSKDGEKDKNKMRLIYYSTKIKAQEIYLSYPCLASNIGLSRIMIQSLTFPD